MVVHSLRIDTMLGDSSKVKQHEAMGQVSGKRVAARVRGAECAAARRTTAAAATSPSISVEVAVCGRGRGSDWRVSG
ncbi:hypothetical protein BHE74_00046749 [Ensete ventricosum]|nr:hypothetical protein BHE74_00046749 [Ensete ventricosum]